jgi:hypothetical protein
VAASAGHEKKLQSKSWILLLLCTPRMRSWLQGSDFYPGGLSPTEHLSFLLDMRLGIPLLFTEEFELVIMIELRPKRCLGRTEFPDPERITTRALVGPAIFSWRAKWRSSSECMPSCARKVLDTADIVREAISPGRIIRD